MLSRLVEVLLRREASQIAVFFTQLAVFELHVPPLSQMELKVPVGS